RLSYAGLQLALAFYLIHLSEFTIQISLTVARDRLVGVLLGTFMMWLVFERFYQRSASDEMIRIFISNLRLMAEMILTTPTDGNEAAIIRIRRQRDQIYRHFGEVNAQSDAVPFETGPKRIGDMAARDRIRRWQASLRTFYLLETPLLQFRIFSKATERMRPFAVVENEFRDDCAHVFQRMAQSLEDQLKMNQQGAKPMPTQGTALLMTRLEHFPAENEKDLLPREQALMRMTRTIAALVDRVQTEVAQEPLYSVE
ncbi:MAG TPA: hypothetical protein VIM62_11360, partial [Acidobacteriaceae bacterium]